MTFMARNTTGEAVVLKQGFGFRNLDARDLHLEPGCEAHYVLVAQTEDGPVFIQVKAPENITFEDESQ